LAFSQRRLPSAAVAAAQGVFVGRAAELDQLEAAAMAARDGQPMVVLVEGEAGIGKSTLLARFASGLPGATVLHASGDETELRLPYGIMNQLVAAELDEGVDPFAAGAELLGWLGQSCRRGEMVLAVIDDLQWADGPSARALLYAVRRLQADHVLVAVSARTAELSRLGEGWRRFLAGDHRVHRVRLGGLGPGDVVALGRALGMGTLPRWAVARLLEQTGGKPLYCRAVLEELGIEGLGGPSGVLRVPYSLAGAVLRRVGSLSPAARELAVAAAILGHRCELAAAAALAGLDDPLPALEETMAAGILVEQHDGARAGIGFTHLLVQQAVYSDLSPVRRRRLHEQAAGLVGWHRALEHRVAAAAGPDDELASDLEVAGWEAHRLGRMAQAAAWLAQAAAASRQPAATDRCLLDALEILVACGEVAEAEVLAARVGAAGPGARRSWLLGTLDFLAGRAGAAEERLREAWQTHDRVREASVGAAAATQLARLCLVAGRIQQAIGWGERAAASVAPAAVRHQALGVLAIAFSADGRGPQVWPGWRACRPPPPRCPGRTPTRSYCGAWPGSSPRTWPGRSRIFPPGPRGCGPVSPCGTPATACATWRAPSTASAPGTTPPRTPSWPSHSPRTPTGCRTSPSCTASPPLFPRCAATARWPARTSGWPPKPARLPVTRRRLRRAPSPRRSLPWPGAIWRASPTPPGPRAPPARRRS